MIGGLEFSPTEIRWTQCSLINPNKGPKVYLVNAITDLKLYLAKIHSTGHSLASESTPFATPRMDDGEVVLRTG